MRPKKRKTFVRARRGLVALDSVPAAQLPGPETAAPAQPSELELDALAQAAHQIARAEHNPQLCSIVLAHAVRLTGAGWGVLVLCEAYSKNCRVAAATDPRATVGMELSLPSRIWTGSSPVKDPLASLWDAPVRHLAAPLWQQNRVFGLLCVYAPAAERGDFNARERQRLEILADLAAGAIHSVQQHENLARLAHGAHLQAALRELSALIARGLGQPELAHALLRYIYSLVPFTWGAIFQRVDTAHLTLVGVNQGRYSVQIRDTQPILLQDFALLRQVVLEGRSARVGSVAQKARWRTPIPGYTTSSWIGVPLRTHSTFGLLSLGSDKPDFFTAEHQTLLELLAFPFALGLQHALLQQREMVARTRLTELAQRALIDQEEERKHVSRELHDQAGQSLTAIIMNLELLQSDLSGQSQTLVDRTRESVAAAREAVQSIRALVRQLRLPVLDMLGFDAAVNQLCQDYRRRHHLDIQLRSAPTGGLPDALALTLYRFIQEGLTNVVRHASASHVTIELTRRRHELVVKLRDDGKGFDADRVIRKDSRSARFGLVGMQERLELAGGTMEIKTEPGKGTLLCARVPLSPNTSEHEKNVEKGRQGKGE